jgi:hypothetical protein
MAGIDGQIGCFGTPGFLFALGITSFDIRSLETTWLSLLVCVCVNLVLVVPI